MELELDDRQRAMLREMGVHVWLPHAQPAANEVPAALPASVRVAPAAALSVVASHVANTLKSSALPAPPTSSPASAGTPLALHHLDWSALAQSAAQCQACGLCAGRKNSTLQAPQVVTQSDWLVLGDPPDEDEDRLGKPFAEQAGTLLDNMLKAAGVGRGGKARAGAYLSNVVKCRSPNGRQPQAEELQQCALYLQREIDLVQPKLILAMGRFAIQLLLREHPEQAALPLGKQRGRVYRYQGIPVVVTYHPKVLLRANSDKAKAWADLCLAMDVLG